MKVELLFADVGCSLDIDELLAIQLENVEFKVVANSLYEIR